MAAIEYPPTLPEPSVADIQSAERRQLSTGIGPQDARAMQRDRQAFQNVTWTFSPQQAEAFQAWYDDVLLEGGAWFGAKWPLPQGWVMAMRKFIGAPAWSHIPVDFWRVTAKCELRGTGALPIAAPPVVECDCSHVAWLTGFEPPVPSGELFRMEAGGLNSAQWGSGQSGPTGIPIYGTRGMQFGLYTDDFILLDDPAQPVQEAFTLNFSIYAPDGSIAHLDQRDIFIVKDSSGSNVLRIWLEDRDEGGFSLYAFYYPNFSGPNNLGPFSYDIKHDFEVALGLVEGSNRLQIWEAGVRIYADGAGSLPSQPITQLQILVSTGSGSAGNSTAFIFDEIRFSNIVEHTEDYVVSLPFCVCEAA